MEEKAKVYFTDFRALPGTNLQKKLEKLMKREGKVLKKIVLRCENLKKNFRSERNFKRCITKSIRRRYFRIYRSKWCW